MGNDIDNKIPNPFGLKKKKKANNPLHLSWSLPITYAPTLPHYECMCTHMKSNTDTCTYIVIPLHVIKIAMPVPLHRPPCHRYSLFSVLMLQHELILASYFASGGVVHPCAHVGLCRMCSLI